AAVPHPDIKALKLAIETDDNFETELFMPGITDLEAGNYDLAILHQLPSRLNNGTEVLKLVQQKQIPTLYIIGAQTNLTELNRLQPGVFISPRGNQTDEVLPQINSGFSRFTFAGNAAATLTKYPPVTVPFADFRLNPNTEII